MTGTKSLGGHQNPPFSPAVRAGGFVFVSGQAAVDENGQVLPGTFEEEMRRSIDNVRRVLATYCLDLTHVVKVGSYVQDVRDVPAYNRIYLEYFTHRPARTTLTSCLGDLVKFEMDVVAFAGDTLSE